MFVSACNNTFFLQFLKDIEEELYKVQLEEEDIRRRINLSNQNYGQLPWKNIIKRIFVNKVMQVAVMYRNQFLFP